MREQVKASILPNFIKGLILAAIAAPFLVGIIFKIIYGFAHLLQHSKSTDDMISTASAFIKFCWVISPNPDLNNYVSWANLLMLIVLAAFAIGLGLMGKAWNDIFRLQDAKRKAEEQLLVDEYKNKR